MHQSYLTSPFTTLNSLWSCLYKITILPLFSPKGRIADAILLNGPGTCVPIVLAAFLPKVRTGSDPFDLERLNSATLDLLRLSSFLDIYRIICSTNKAITLSSVGATVCGSILCSVEGITRQP